jgi:hypothetical protein
MAKTRPTESTSSLSNGDLMKQATWDKAVQAAKDRGYTRIIRKTWHGSHPFDADEWFGVLGSTHVRAAGLKGRHLIIQFIDGSVYQYSNAGDHFLTMIASSSVGSYFHRWVKGKFAYQQLERGR